LSFLHFSFSYIHSFFPYFFMSPRTQLVHLFVNPLQFPGIFQE
jgi:hypothetical protein